MVEDRFNKKYQYPYVFLNEDDFTEDFKKSVWYIAYPESTTYTLYQAYYCFDRRESRVRQDPSRALVPT